MFHISDELRPKSRMDVHYQNNEGWLYGVTPHTYIFASPGVTGLKPLLARRMVL